MITKEYVLQMAKYNAWENKQMRDILHGVSADDLTRDSGAFFGSMFATVNHILWGDTMWMSRWCSDIAAPESSDNHTTLTPDFPTWEDARFRMDGRILIWAQTLSTTELDKDLEWYSGMTKRNFIRPISLCITHMFNHQTHHRGQISQMLSASGYDTPISDLVLIPENI
ncbi:MAG: DinB family protein [Sulfitobacter sp.]